MNKDWSELNKTMQAQLKKKDTFDDGIATLLELRKLLWNTISSYKKELKREDFDSIPFINADGYHSKTIAYSLWHIFRIEDIVAHTLIKGDEQVFFAKGYQEKTCSPIITTGNELVKMEISDFSGKLDLDALYSYISDVKKSTDKILKGLSFEDTKIKISDDRRKELESLGVVSEDESAIWLIDYWCKKDVRGLIQMPFS
ncbi:MAG: phage head-tail adapter protein, partial [Lachnospiraceae bacterium]|nr:phage head-tail adapter protein [Lachnospiraceae bacterium]